MSDHCGTLCIKRIKILDTRTNHYLKSTAFGGCFRIKAQSSYLFKANTRNLLSFCLLLFETIATRLRLATFGPPFFSIIVYIYILASNTSELFEWSSVIPEQPLATASQKKVFHKRRQNACHVFGLNRNSSIALCRLAEKFHDQTKFVEFIPEKQKLNWSFEHAHITLFKFKFLINWSVKKSPK